MEPQITQATQPTQQPIQPTQPVQNPGPQRLWETFEYVLMFISLYVVASSTGLSLHALVNKYIPDSASSGGSGDFSDYMVKWALAALFVTLPIFAILYFDLIRRVKKNPNLKSLSSHKKLIYITLIITFIIMVENLVRVVFALLDGSLILNFILHFAVSSGICGLIFTHFLLEVRDDRQQIVTP